MNLEKMSIWLGKIVRHEPECIGAVPDRYGWIDTEVILKGMDISLVDLERVINFGKKKRYTFNNDKSKVRAFQGHTFKVDLLLEEATPPSILYHGTLLEWKDIIDKEGLKSMNRHHVHLSADTKTAKIVAKRRKKPIHIFEINTEDMIKEGYTFYLAENGVWLVDSVPSKYFI